MPTQALIFENGAIRTMSVSAPLLDRLAVRGRYIVPAGAVLDSRERARRVNLGGRCVVPGFTDAHVHFARWALGKQGEQLGSEASLGELLARVGNAVATAPHDRWLVGRGWRSGQWNPARDPTRHDLDSITGTIRTALWAHDGHTLVLNSAALPPPGTLDTLGDIVERDERGEPTGILRENAAWRFRDRFILPDTTPDEWMAAIRAGLKFANANGVTAIHDMDGGLGVIRYWNELASTGELSIRVWQGIPPDSIEALRTLGIGSGFGNDLVRIGFVKTFADGTLGSNTALLLDGTGQAVGEEDLGQLIQRAATAGLPVAVHAIGDRAVRQCLDAFESARHVWEPGNLRPRIEHASLIAPEDISRFARLGVAASVQFSFAPSDQELVHRNEYWAAHIDSAYPFRSLATAGTHIANGSDAPVEPLDPLAGIRAGVVRTLDERPPWQPHQALTLHQALAATTTNPAWLCHEEHRRGKLAPGCLADLVVLNEDPFSVPDKELDNVEVVATMMNGRWVHGEPPWT